MMQRVIRIGIWSAAVVFFIALAVRDLQLDRRLDIVARLDRATPYLSTLGPPSRVALSVDRVTMLGEPVYVNLRIPRWFRRVTVEIRYENQSNLPFKLGVRTHPIQWAFQFPDPEGTHPLPFPLPGGGGEKEKEFPSILPGGGMRGGGEIMTMRVPFDLQRAWQVERNVYRFVLSAPGASTEQPIVVRGLRVTAERDPVCLVRFCL